jgi:hypothetical protein
MWKDRLESFSGTWTFDSIPRVIKNSKLDAMRIASQPLLDLWSCNRTGRGFFGKAWTVVDIRRPVQTAPRRIVERRAFIFGRCR